MKWIAVVALVVLFLAFSVQAQSSVQTKNVSAEQELIKLEDEWTNAMLKRDWSVLERILTDDFTDVTFEGSVLTKAQDIADLKSGALTLTSLVADEMKVRVYGDAAVVTGRNTLKGKYQGMDINGQIRWTDTWVKHGGRWQCVATHGSKVAQK